MKKFEMRLDPEPFQKIKSGEKTIEVRLLDDKRKNIKAGDIIIFYNRSRENEAVAAEVVTLHKFKTFKELFSSGLTKGAGLGCLSATEAAVYMHKFYTAEQEKLYGVLGIEIRVNPDLTEAFNKHS